MKSEFSTVCQIAAHVLQIPEGGDYEAQNLKIVQMFNRSKKLHINTKTPHL